MKIPLNEAFALLKSALDTSKEVVSRFSDEEYAKAVKEIYGYEPEYKELDLLAEVIANATDISTNEKSELLMAITERKIVLKKTEIECTRECAKIVDKGFKQKCKYTSKLVLGIITGGLSLLPDAYHAIERRVADKEY